MTDALSASAVRELLRLEPHPTCGYVAETYRSPERIAAGARPAPFADGRPIGTALVFLVTPERPVRPHRTRNDQLYHHYLGDPLEVRCLHDDGSHATHVVGGDLTAGQRCHLFIPAGTYHAARLATGGQWHLGASTEWPGVEPSDVEPADVARRTERHPVLAEFLGREPS